MDWVGQVGVGMDEARRWCRGAGSEGAVRRAAGQGGGVGGGGGGQGGAWREGPRR